MGGCPILQSFSCKGTVLLRNRPCWVEIETRGDIFAAAPCSDGPFMTRRRGFCRDTDVCPGFQGLFWDEWATGLAAVGSR